MKFRLVKYPFNDGEKVLYNCPGCGYEHAFSSKVHTWNGDFDNPTVSPSLLHTNPQQWHVCHSFIRDGKIQFLGDCWHDLKNQTVDLPDYPEGQRKIIDFSTDNRF